MLLFESKDRVRAFFGKRDHAKAVALLHGCRLLMEGGIDLGDLIGLHDDLPVDPDGLHVVDEVDTATDE